MDIQCPPNRASTVLVGWLFASAAALAERRRTLSKPGEANGRKRARGSNCARNFLVCYEKKSLLLHLSLPCI